MSQLVKILLSALFIASWSCTNKSGTVVEKTEAPKPETIKLFAQAGPGGDPFDFDMPIDKGLDKLEIVDQSEANIDSSEIVLGFVFEDLQLALPMKYMSGFEVANLNFESSNYLLTWCPLVGSARIFEGTIGSDQSGFDFGRGLIDNNLLIVDRKTNSVWNQLSCKAVVGELKGERLSPLPSIQSTWAFWQNKYPDTRLLVNKDTAGAVFPQFVLQKQYYHTWTPGTKFPREQAHRSDNLGLGVELANSSVFFPLEKLVHEDSPILFQVEGEQLTIHFEASGLTAWAENDQGELLPGTMVYQWAWNNFFPETITYEN